jgi:hypothetical protein
MKFLCAILLCSTIAGAETAPAIYHTFSQPCDTVKPAALTYFSDRQMALTPSPSCKDCYQGTTRHLHDAEGHRLFSNRNIIERNTTNNLKYEKIGPLQQIVHWDLTTESQLQFFSVGNTCQASLRFSYSWYGAQLILGFPVDGDPSSAPSNGKLETAYLNALQQQLDHASVAHR